MKCFHAKIRGRSGKIAITVCAFLLIIMIIGIMIFQSKKTTPLNETYKIITIPLKINNSLYIGEHPLYQNQESKEYYFPVEPLANMLGMTYEADGDSCKIGSHVIQPEKELNATGIPYISTSTLQSFQDIHVYYEDLMTKAREVIFIDNFPQPFDYSWTENQYIAHAFGSIDGHKYTNSLEAFKANYEKGHRVFEVDFSLTSDHDLVAVHDWSENTFIKACGIKLPDDKKNQQLTAEEFLNFKLHGKYTPMSFKDIVLLMKEYPDIYIVTDTKEIVEPYITEQFQLMKDIADKYYPEALDRIIPQIYNEQMFDSVMNIYEWKSIIYTLYCQGNEFSEKNTIDFAYKNGIKVISTYVGRDQELFFDELFQRGNIIYMHTYNSIEEFEYLKARGVTGIYTDFLTPES